MSLLVVSLIACEALSLATVLRMIHALLYAPAEEPASPDGPAAQQSHR